MPKSDQPRERLIHFGEQALSSIEILALLLRSGTPGENALRLAERLLVTFGGIEGLAHAAIADLQKIKGIGPDKAAVIKASAELGWRLLQQPAEEDGPRVVSPAVAANLLIPEMRESSEPIIKIVLLNTRNKLIGVETITLSPAADVRRVAKAIFQLAIKANAAAVILAHNHQVDEGAEPSPQDIDLTAELVKAGQLFSIEVLDHLIVCEWEYVSLKERGWGIDSW